MKTFAGQQIEPLFQFSWLIVFLTLLLCGGLGLLFAFTVDLNLGIAISLSFLALLYIFFSKFLLFVFFPKIETMSKLIVLFKRVSDNSFKHWIEQCHWTLLVLSMELSTIRAMGILKRSAYQLHERQSLRHSPPWS